jgi:hypothetical protein
MFAGAAENGNEASTIVGPLPLLQIKSLTDNSDRGT